MESRKNIAGIGLFIFGLILVGIGLFRGETAIVMQKAVHMCLECIGIG